VSAPQIHGNFDFRVRAATARIGSGIPRPALLALLQVCLLLFLLSCFAPLLIRHRGLAS
jgi:hypothetical protein